MITLRRRPILTKTIDGVRDLKYPTKKSELSSSPGLCSVYRQFAVNFALVAAPLKKRVKKGDPKKFELNDDVRRMVNDLKRKLKSPAFLTLLRPQGQFVVRNDACDKQVGCVLLQELEFGKFRQIGYLSKTLNDVEKNYDSNREECLALVWANFMLYPYLKEGLYVVKTNHQSL